MASEKHRTGKSAAIKEGDKAAKFNVPKHKNEVASAKVQGPVPSTKLSKGYTLYKKFSF